MSASTADHETPLERVFLHELLDTVQGLHGLGQVLQRGGADPHEAGVQVERLASRVLDEIYGHRRLLEAEHGTLEVLMQELGVQDLLDQLADHFTGHALVAQRELRLGRGRGRVRTDRALALWALTSLVKNGLEATEPGQTVLVETRQRSGQVHIEVSNPGEVPEAVRARLFQRGTTTKGPGRGLGLWSARLLAQGYLGGQVDCDCAQGRTVFSLTLPALPALRGIG